MIALNKEMFDKHKYFSSFLLIIYLILSVAFILMASVDCQCTFVSYKIKRNSVNKNSERLNAQLSGIFGSIKFSHDAGVIKYIFSNKSCT